jgi:hypothetical protein
MEKRLSFHQILANVEAAHPKKKRVTFFIPEISKHALTQWCRARNVTESSTIDAMIRMLVSELPPEGGNHGEVS